MSLILRWWTQRRVLLKMRHDIHPIAGHPRGRMTATILGRVLCMCPAAIFATVRIVFGPAFADPLNNMIWRVAPSAAPKRPVEIFNVLRDDGFSHRHYQGL
jgi:hypothetical protein